MGRPRPPSPPTIGSQPGARIGHGAYSSHVGGANATRTRTAKEHGGSPRPDATHRPMPVLPTTIDPSSETFRANQGALEEAVDKVNEQLAVTRAGGGEQYVARHKERDKLLARERIELLLDQDSAFLELCALAAWGTEYRVGASSIMGIGVVEGVECLITAHDPTVRGGAMNPYSFRKGARASDIALQNRMPVINLVESGGADLPAQAELFIPGGRAFRDLTRSSAAALPTVALVFGNSTAGGAYVPGMSDYIVMIEQRSKVFLGGPPAGQDGNRRGVDRRGARWSLDACPGLGARRLPGRRRGRRHSPGSPDREPAELAQARPRADPAGR